MNVAETAAPSKYPKGATKHVSPTDVTYNWTNGVSKDKPGHESGKHTIKKGERFTMKRSLHFRVKGGGYGHITHPDGTKHFVSLGTHAKLFGPSHLASAQEETAVFVSPVGLGEGRGAHSVPASKHGKRGLTSPFGPGGIKLHRSLNAKGFKLTKAEHNGNQSDYHYQHDDGSKKIIRQKTTRAGGGISRSSKVVEATVETAGLQRVLSKGKVCITASDDAKIHIEAGDQFAVRQDGDQHFLTFGGSDYCLTASDVDTVLARSSSFIKE